MIKRFADPADEIEYRIAERAARAPINRILSLIGCVILFLYLLMNPLFIDLEAVKLFTVVSVPLMGVLLVYGQVTRWPIYPKQPWIDLLFFVIFGAMLGVLAAIIAAEASYTGWPAHVILAENSIILLAFSCFVFAGAVRWFLAWCAVLTLAFLAILLWFIEAAEIAKIYATINFLTILFLVIYANWELDARSRTVFDLRNKLEEEKKNVEDLLYNVLPQPVAERLRAGQTIADAFMDVSVIFIDVVGFSGIAKTLSAGHLVELLNRFFSIADASTEGLAVEKIKTVGDAYLAIAGAMMPCGNSGMAALQFALRVIEGVQKLEAETGIDFKVRVGIHTGPVVGGVIGSKRMAYDYWGDTMNVASRLQEAASPNGVSVSEATYFRTKNGQAYRPPRTILLKGIGESQVYDAEL